MLYVVGAEGCLCFFGSGVPFGDDCFVFVLECFVDVVLWVVGCIIIDDDLYYHFWGEAM